MRHKITIIVGILIFLGILILLNNAKLTGDTINEGATIEKEIGIKNNANITEKPLNIIEKPLKDIEFEITKADFISYIDNNLNERNKLVISGILTNNLNKKLDKLESQARFYNEISKDKELVHLMGISNIPLKVWATNQYINRNAFFYIKESPSRSFQNGKNLFELTFYDIPSNIPRKSLLKEGIIKNKDWFVGKYDVDSMDLIFYNEGKNIKKINLEMPKRYISDISINITGMNWINPGGHKTLLDSISFIIKNPKQNKLEDPKLVFTAYDKKTREQISTFTINIPPQKIIDSTNYVRLISEEDYLMKFDKENLSHLALFELYDGEELIDKNYFVWYCKEKEFSDTISYFPCLTLTPWVYLKENSSLNIKIEELFAGGKENYHTGIEIKVSEDSRMKYMKEQAIESMKEPVIEIFCGNSWVYDFDISQIEEFIELEFGTGAFCIEPQVFLREKDSSFTYAEDTYLAEDTSLIKEQSSKETHLTAENTSLIKEQFLELSIPII